MAKAPWVGASTTIDPVPAINLSDIVARTQRLAEKASAVADRSKAISSMIAGDCPNMPSAPKEVTFEGFYRQLAISLGVVEDALSVIEDAMARL